MITLQWLYEPIDLFAGKLQGKPVIACLFIDGKNPIASFHERNKWACASLTFKALLNVSKEIMWIV